MQISVHAHLECITTAGLNTMCLVTLHCYYKCFHTYNHPLASLRKLHQVHQAKCV